MLSLNVYQREALRHAAEQKWLSRNPAFKPQNLNILEPPHAVPTTVADKAQTVPPAVPKADQPREPEAYVAEIEDDRQTKKMLKATKQALAVSEGLVVPVSRNHLFASQVIVGLIRNAHAAALRNITRNRISPIGIATT